MEINPARINWFQNGSNYEELVKDAADQAGGNAFITEFAGPTALFKGQIFQPSRYNLEAIRTAATPPDALDRIGSQGFPRDSALLSILRNQIPMPESLRPDGDRRSDLLQPAPRLLGSVRSRVQAVQRRRPGRRAGDEADQPSAPRPRPCSTDTPSSPGWPRSSRPRR